MYTINEAKESQINEDLLLRNTNSITAMDNNLEHKHEQVVRHRNFMELFLIQYIF